MTGKTEMTGMNYILATCHEDFTPFMQSFSSSPKSRKRKEDCWQGGRKGILYQRLTGWGQRYWLVTADRVGVKISAGNCLQGGGKGIRWQLLTGWG